MLSMNEREQVNPTYVYMSRARVSESVLGGQGDIQGEAVDNRVRVEGMGQLVPWGAVYALCNVYVPVGHSLQGVLVRAILPPEPCPPCNIHDIVLTCALRDTD